MIAVIKVMSFARSAAERGANLPAMNPSSRYRFLLLTALLLPLHFAFPAEREYRLTIAETTVNFSGRPQQALTVNGGIPAPTLYFKEGDEAVIRVTNGFRRPTSIHWHGLLIPPGMDGVPFVSFPPIQPGATFTYRFPIRQRGTFWYHSHSELQEQRGMYGAFVIQPRGGPLHPPRDHAVVLSDWTDENVKRVAKTLRRGSEWYAVQRGNSQTLFGSIAANRLGDWFKRELQRMPPMDLSDVAYDAFLANGQAETRVPAGAGETVRLRIVDGSAMSFFHLTYAGGKMEIVTADGQPVEPVKVGRLLIAVAETYDLRLKVPGAGAYELRATAHDGSGYSSTWIGEGERHYAPPVPSPNLYTTMGKLTPAKLFALTPAGAMGMPDGKVNAGMFDQPGMKMDGRDDMPRGKMKGMGKMEGMKHEQMPAMDGMNGMPHEKMKEMGAMEDMPQGKKKMDGMEHEQMPEMEGMSDMAADGVAAADVPQERQAHGGKKFTYNFIPMAPDLAARRPLVEDGMSPLRPGPPYAKLRATQRTAFSPKYPRRDVRLTLDGSMERYVWMLNNRILAERDEIKINAGEVVRFIMINRTMMHHPMHLHGHFFRVLNEQGDYSPLKHTVDVKPMSTTVIEFKANEVGDWFFHCHLLYHLEAGMAGVVSYNQFTPPPAVQAVRSKLYHDRWYFLGMADVMTNMAQGYLELSSARHIFSLDWQYGWKRVPENELELTPRYDYWINRFTTVFAGAEQEWTGGKLEDTIGFVGAHYLLPFNIETSARVDNHGDFEFSFGREIMLTPRLGVYGAFEYNTATQWEQRVGATYMISREISLIGQWHSDYGYGGGLTIRF